MKKLLLLFSAFLGIEAYSQQCEINTFATEETITCGDCVSLSAFGSGAGNIAFEEDFNSGSPVGWQFTQTVTIGNNTCGVPSPDGTDFMWMGDASVNPRDMTTVPLNLTLGGTICFEMRYSVQGDASPCEGPDEPDEGVYLQYSINNGASWVTIQYWDPLGGNNNGLTNWNQYCAVLPPGALTATTQIRWHQDAVSGAVYDHWGIDNVTITLNDPTFGITWLHDNYSYGLGNGGGVNPTPVCPTETTTYTAQITNGTVTCTSTITVNVVDPVFVIDLGNDTTICPGECVTLNATAYELVSPASTPTFTNQETSIVTGGSSSMNINVQGLNTTSISPGSVTSVCLTGFNFSGTQICTSFGGCMCNGASIGFGDQCNLDISSFNVTLTSPSGCEMLLVPAGTATGTSYSNVCFVPAGGQAITGGGFPTAGDWTPSESFDELNGCDPNGNWTMTLNAPGGLGFGLGSLQGWSISFDDPEITNPVNFTWSPTTNMTNSTTLNPTICPTATTTFTLTVTDTDNCSSATEDITITIGQCCQLEIDATQTTNPDCGVTNGSITVTATGQTTGLLFTLNGGTPQAVGTFTGLGAGTYQIGAIDDNDCPVTTTVTLTNPNSPVIDDVIETQASCGLNDGTLVINASGGTTPFEYSINNGTSFQAANSFNNLAVGTYQIQVTDDNNCTVSGTAEITNPNAPVIDNITEVDASCGQNDGSVSIVVSGGTAPFEYSSDNGVTFGSSATISNLSPGTYDIVVIDDNNCEVSGTATIEVPDPPVITNIALTTAECNQQNGGIVVTATGSNPLNYSIDNGATFQQNGTFTNLAPGSYTVVVEDPDGCSATQTVTVLTTNLPNIGAGNDVSVCAGESVTLNGTGGVTYTWNNGVTNGTPFTPTASGTYTVTGTDVNGCVNTDQVVVTVVPNPNASFTATPAVGNSPLVVTFDNTSTNGSNYVWNFGNGNPPISVGNTSDQTTTYTNPGVYTTTLVASNGNCTDIFTDTIVVLGFPPIEIHIPNVFTPNNDNFNDQFFIEVINGRTILVEIYNRWGNKMFEMTDFTTKWDGKDASDGVYFFTYRIESLDNEVYEGHGHVSLIRN